MDMGVIFDPLPFDNAIKKNYGDSNFSKKRPILPPPPQPEKHVHFYHLPIIKRG